MSLAQYVARMPEGQTSIYYAIGPSTQMLEHSPTLETLKQRGYEVLYMTDGVDQWAVEGLRDYEGKPLINAMEADLKLDGSDKAEDESEGTEDGKDKEKKADAGDLAPLLERCRDILSEHVSEVRVSSRLTAVAGVSGDAEGRRAGAHRAPARARTRRICRCKSASSSSTPITS